MRRVLLSGVAVVVGGVAGADDPPGVKAKTPPPADKADKPRAFTGSIQVPPDKREEVLKLLKEKGLKGAYVPETAAPETVMYRGAKEDYEAASDAVMRHLHPEWFAPRGPRPAPDRKPPVDDPKALGASPLQKELLEELMAKADKRKGEFAPGPGGPTQEQIKKGMEFNGWWRGEWKAVLTREQYTRWAGANTAARDLGPEPKKPEVDPKAEKSDEIAFAQLGLSEKQQEYLAAARKKVAAAKADKAADADKLRTANAEYQKALSHALTETQLREYRKYWDGR